MSASWSQDPELRVEHLTMRFGGLTAIGDLSFDAGRKQITALIGPNGAGKTTVFNCITGFYKPTEGTIKHRHPDGKEFLLERMDDFIITQQSKVARTFQNIRLFGGMTVLENLMVAQHNELMKASSWTIGGLLGSGKFRRREQEAIETAKFWLERTGLTDRADDPAGDLPYGAQRRLEIARAMCTSPRLLCLDEPAAGLNPRESEELNKLLLSIRDQQGVAILLIEHDMSVVMGISDHIVVLDYGRKISDGNPDHVKNDPAVIRAYLGVDDDADDLNPAKMGLAKGDEIRSKVAAAPVAAQPAGQPKTWTGTGTERFAVPPPPVLEMPDAPVSEARVAEPAKVAAAPVRKVVSAKKVAKPAKKAAKAATKTAAKKTVKKTSKKGGRT